jgi:hypothetical protein
MFDATLALKKNVEIEKMKTSKMTKRGQKSPKKLFDRQTDKEKKKNLEIPDADRQKLEQRSPTGNFGINQNIAKINQNMEVNDSNRIPSNPVTPKSEPISPEESFTTGNRKIQIVDLFTTQDIASNFALGDIFSNRVAMLNIY